MRVWRRTRRGLALVVVLIAITLLSLAGFTFAELMFAEHEGAAIHGRRLQSRALAASGAEYATWLAAQDLATIDQAGGLYDNPDRFRGMLVRDDTLARDRGRFTIVAPNVADEGAGGVRFGLENESAKLNLNALVALDAKQSGVGQKMLLGLPGMTDEIADAILDWIDADDEQRQLGAERDHYTGASPACVPKNGPLATVEELLRVRGVTPELLFGLDANRNGAIDANEGGTTVGGVDNADGGMNFGWSAYLTLYSAETNTKADGTAKIDLNATDLQQLHKDLAAVLDEDQASFVAAYRQGSVVSGTMQTPMNVPTMKSISAGSLDLTKPGNTKFKSVLDLIGAKIQLTLPNASTPVIVESPFANDPSSMKSYLPKLMANATLGSGQVIPGRVNVNQAPRAVLAGLPGMNESILDRILAERIVDPGDANPDRQNETWLLSEGVVTLDEMKQLLPVLTAGGRVYRAQVVGFFDDVGPASRIEVVVDATASPPRRLLWRELSHLGRGFDAAALGASSTP